MRVISIALYFPRIHYFLCSVLGKAVIVRLTPELRELVDARRLGDENTAQATRRILRETLRGEVKPI